MLNVAKRKRPPPKKTKGQARAVETIDEFGLTPKQRLFADNYLIDQNGSAAYVKAGYTVKNDNVAAASASTLLRRPKVAAYIESRLKKVSDKLGITLERTLQEIGRMGYVDPRKFLKDDGTLVALKDLDEDSARALAGFDVSEVVVGGEKGDKSLSTVTTKIKFEKISALDKLMRFHGAYKDKVEHGGPDGGPIVYRMSKRDEAL